MPAAPQSVPIRLYYEGGCITADWVDIAGTDPGLPFLSDRIATARDLWRAPLPAVGEGAAPAALILHAGRCGSTLVSRSLSLMRRCHVLSEPAVLNEVLSVDGVWPFLPSWEKREALRRVVEGLTRSARPNQDQVILKLSSWNAMHLPLLEEALPAVPKLFIYRRPEEILVSLRSEPAGWMHRAGHEMQAKLFLGEAPARTSDTPLAFAAQVLGRSMAAVADSVERSVGEWLLVPYETLPDALVAKILPWLGLEPTIAEADILASVAGIHAKDPAGQRRFKPDSLRKQALVTAELAALATDLVGDPYDRLERLRLRDAVG